MLSRFASHRLTAQMIPAGFQWAYGDAAAGVSFPAMLSAQGMPLAFPIAWVPSLNLLTVNADGSLSLPSGATYGRTSTAMALDYAGVYQTLAAGYPRFQGARYSGNAAYWQLSDGTPLHPTHTVDGQLIFDTYPIWAAATTYGLGARRIPTTGSGPAGGDGYWYYVSAITTGISGGAEPAWAASVVDGGVTWTRGGYYRIAGYLHEQAASQNISGGSVLAYSNVEDATRTATNILAPDGTLSATNVTENTNNINHDVYTASSLSHTANNKIISAYVKQPAASPVNIVSINLGTGGLASAFGVKFDFRTGLASALAIGAGTCSAVGCQSIGSGWYRLWAVGVMNTVGALYNSLSLYNDSGNRSYTGTSRSLYYWQSDYIENSSVLTSPILSTATGVVTRAADTLTLPAAAFSDAQGTLVYDIAHPYWTQAAGQVLGDGTEAVALLSTANSGLQSNDGTSTINGPAGTPSGTMRHAIRWSGSLRQLAVNGVAATAGAYDGSFNLSSLIFGSSLNATVRNLRIYLIDGGAAKVTDLSARDFF